MPPPAAKALEGRAGGAVNGEFCGAAFPLGMFRALRGLTSPVRSAARCSFDARLARAGALPLHPTAL